MTGDSIGHYRIEEKLGEGGVGEVYRAVDPVLGRVVAVKRLRPQLADRDDVVERFRAEACTLARLDHPSIATLYHFERDDEDWFMVMEYVAGETLASVLRRCGRLELEYALPLFAQALDALGYAHDQGVVHRDIKGSNLIVKPCGTVKVMDFGIARVDGAERLTQMGQPVGTPEYMAPEQIRGEHIDRRADIYALGVLFYALLSGRPPFSGRSDYELMRAQIEEQPDSLADRSQGLPASIVAAIDRALAKDPAERFQTTAEFREALTPGSPALAPRPLGAAPVDADARDEALRSESLAVVEPESPLLFPASTTHPLGLGDLLDEDPDSRSGPIESDTRTLTGARSRMRRVVGGALAAAAVVAVAIAAANGVDWLASSSTEAVEHANPTAEPAPVAADRERAPEAVPPPEAEPTEATGSESAEVAEVRTQEGAGAPPRSEDTRGEPRAVRDLPVARSAPAPQPARVSAEEKKSRTSAASRASRPKAAKPSAPAAPAPGVRVRRGSEPVQEEPERWRIRRQ